jgi:hypothetical protein
LQHPSRKLISQRVEVLAEVHFIVHLRLDPSNSRELRIRYMRRRAEEVGAELDVISAPGPSTTIQFRFDNR